MTQAVLLFWWVAFWPGTLSYDSVMYVWQVSTGNWTTQHSVLYNALVWLSLRATGGLAALSLLQTVALAAGIAYAVTGLHRLGARARWLVLAAVAIVALPAIGTFAVYISKDVGFAVTEVWLLGTAARIVGTRVVPVRALAVEFVLLGLFRQNGFVVIGLTAVIMVVALRLAHVLSGQRWRVVGCAAGAIVVGSLANLVVYPALGVSPTGPELVWGPAYADIAVAYSHRPGDFTAADRAVLAKVAPLEYWAGSANCYNADSTVSYGNPEFNFEAAHRYQSDLVDLWLRLIKRMPDEMIATRLCRGAIAWNPFPGPARGRTVKVPIGGTSTYFDFPPDLIDQSPYAGAITSAPLSGRAHSLGVFVRKVSDTRSFEWIAWRGATWCYLAYLAVFAYGRRRRDAAAAGLVAVIAATQLNVLINNPGQLMRYLAPPMILSALLLPLAGATRAPTLPPEPTLSWRLRLTNALAAAKTRKLRSPAIITEPSPPPDPDEHETPARVP